MDELPKALHHQAVLDGASFFDANDYAEAGVDGLHWTAESHQRFAAALNPVIRRLDAQR